MESTHTSIDLELVDFVLLLDHEKCVVEQEYHQLRAITLPSATLLQRALVNKLAAFLLQPEILFLLMKFKS